VLSQGLFDASVLLRNGEQLVVSLLFPVVVLVGLLHLPLGDLGVPAALADLPRVDVVTPGVLGLAVVSTAFTGQAIQLGFDRRYGVLRLMATTPLGRGGLLAGRLVAVAVVEVLQVVVLSVLALALGWHPLAHGGVGPLVALLALVLGTVAFGALALLLAGTLRAEAVLAIANVLYLVLAAAGLVLPRQGLPGPLSAVVAVLPSSALGDLARGGLLDGALAARPLLVLLVWAAGVAALVTRTFRWS
jgi:ABC-2 type transport system permease protein